MLQLKISEGLKRAYKEERRKPLSGPLSEGHKEKLSVALKKAYAEGRRLPNEAWNKGRTGVYSEETLQKMSDAAKRREAAKRAKRLPESAWPA